MYCLYCMHLPPVGAEGIKQMGYACGSVCLSLSVCVSDFLLICVSLSVW